MTQDHFGDRLAAALRRYGPLCVGLDPYPDRIPSAFGAPGPGTLEAFCACAIEQAAGRVGVVKPQIALFERFGPEGLAALARLTHRARGAGLAVLLDAKRGDIGATAAGYAEAYLGDDAWLYADAMTVNAYMGAESLAPFLALADARGKGVIALVRTSNPGAGDLQDLPVGDAPVYEHMASALAPLAETRRGPDTGWSSLMFVVGATAPQEARAIRAIAPAAPFLTPGYGAQGGTAADALAGAVWRAGRADGVTVNASRSVLYPDEAGREASIEDWAEAAGRAIDAAQADLVAAHAPAPS